LITTNPVADDDELDELDDPDEPVPDDPEEPAADDDVEEAEELPPTVPAIDVTVPATGARRTVASRVDCASLTLT
jgi:hypothetical protein